MQANIPDTLYYLFLVSIAHRAIVGGLEKGGGEGTKGRELYVSDYLVAL